MSTTQEHIQIKEFGDDIIFLKDGGGALVLSVSAVNFGLLSEREQVGIIASFAQMLNSLSFSIQIMVHSKRLNISSYLLLLDKAQKSQTNPLLSKMMTSYKTFIQALIKENEVLDKSFYVIIPLFKLELGLSASKETLKQKIQTILLPRRDQITRQLARAGLRATQLTSEKLVELFFNIYNELYFENIQLPIEPGQTQPTTLKTPISVSPSLPKTTPTPKPPLTQPMPSKTHPFVVEELEEE